MAVLGFSLVVLAVIMLLASIYCDLHRPQIDEFPEWVR